MFTARYGLSPYIKQIRCVLKGLGCNCGHMNRDFYISRPHNFSVDKIGEIYPVFYLKNYRCFSNIPKVVARWSGCMIRLHCFTSQCIHRSKNVKQFSPFLRFGRSENKDVFERKEWISV